MKKSVDTLISTSDSTNEGKIVNPNDNADDYSNANEIDYLKSVKSTTGKFALNDLTNEFCLVFGIGKNEPDTAWENINLDSLIGFIVEPTYEEFINLRELRAQRCHIYPKNDSLPICEFDSSLLIPFASGESITHITKWNILSPDSIIFDKLIQPPINSVYAIIASLEIIELKNENYISIYLQGGEGGEDWDELIIGKLDGKDKFKIIADEVIGYCHDCGDWAKISLKVNPNGFEITEIRDSMKLINDNWEREWQKTKKLKIIKL